MPNDAAMNTEHDDATYHDAHLDDAAEWDESSAEDWPAGQHSRLCG